MSAEVAAPSEKQIAIEALRRMPESATLQDISEEMAVLAAIRRGVVAAGGSRLLSHKEVKRRSTAWILESSGTK